MMADIEKDEGGCAFPLHEIDGVIDYGMSLRDYFAAQSIAGLSPGSMLSDHGIRSHAENAYRLADAMIAARKR